MLMNILNSRIPYQNAAEISHVALINPSTHFTAALLCIETRHFFMHMNKNANANSCEQKCVAKDDLWLDYTAFENILFSLFFFHSYLITSR